MTERRVLLDAAEFLDSRHAEALEFGVDAVRTIAQRFLAAAYEDVGKAPKKLDEQDLAVMLEQSLPLRFAARDPLAVHAGAVWSALLEFLIERDAVPIAFEWRAALAAHVERFEQVVAEGRAHDAGMLRTKVETVRHRASKTGRNDPCPCGSGRKFKKCCGAK